MKKPREGIEPPVCVNETQNATLAKKESCTVPTLKINEDGQQALLVSRYPRQEKLAWIASFNCNQPINQD
ncbi:hypothetical protein [Allocoleopsis sp.]|uniref:hypothetical protein n=1 Tax=Allocoleopsis sp. TaxID=3088169 RepID=UPI002FD09EA6